MNQLTEFMKKVEKHLKDGEQKYGDSYREMDQAQYIIEKARRFKGSGAKARNREDFEKIAALAYLGWVKEGVRKPNTMAYCAYSGWSARMLKRLGVVQDYEIFDHPVLEVADSYDIMLSLGYKWHIPPAVYNAYDEAFNLHPGKLPEYRGKNPHERALKNGETSTCATLHRITDRFDAGEIVYEVPVEIREGDTPDSLIQKLKVAGIICVYNYWKERRWI